MTDKQLERLHLHLQRLNAHVIGNKKAINILRQAIIIVKNERKKKEKKKDQPGQC